MEFFQFCLEVINREVKIFNVAFDVSGLKKLSIVSANNANYELIKKRCHFLYKCGTIHLYFAKVCFKTFLLDQKIVGDLLSEWNNCADLTFCSISTGPALDYIALMHSFQESGMIPPLFKNIKIVSKYGAWKNTINIMHKTICEGYLKSLPSVAVRKIKLVQGDLFDDSAEIIDGKVKSAISSSDVVMMMKRLNLQLNGYDQKKTSKSIKVFLDALKPGAVLFCIDTKQSVKEITQLLNLLPGTFLLKPTSQSTVINFDCPKVIKEHVGCLPILSDAGGFFVWRKSSVPNLFSKNTSSSFDMKSNGHQFENSATNFLAHLDCRLPSTSSQNVSDYLKSQAINLCSSGSGSATACTQTESDEILQETEAKRIMELSHKIENLTVELAGILEKCESDSCLPSNDGIHGECSSVISCSRISDCIQSSERCCCDRKHALSQSCFSCDHNRANTSSCNFQASNFNNPPLNCTSTISAQNNLLPSAQLVIPLTNLSADIVSQIVTLISQSEQRNAADD